MTIQTASNSAVEYPLGNKEFQTLESLETRTDLKADPVSGIDIIDIRHDAAVVNLKDEILGSLRPENGPKTLPTLLLYDERGLQLFEKITYLEEYYLTNAEIDVLQRSADSIAKAIPSGSMVIELGSGNLRKVSILLRALEAAAKNIDYYALDLSVKELKRTLEQVPNFKCVKCHGLHGTYDDGLDWLKTPENASRTKCVMSLGSSIGNFHRNEAAAFLGRFTETLGQFDSLLIGLDATDNPAKVYDAYNDREGLTHEFVLNGLLQANEILGEEVFRLEDWKVIGEYVYDHQGGRHQAFYSPNRNVQYKDIVIKAGERIQVEQSLKYSPQETIQLWKGSRLQEVDRWSATSDAYSVHLLAKEQMAAFNTDPAVYAASAIPTLEDWKGLWQVWDVVTQQMISDEELLEKPIKLRNACIFYLGHIPTFLDIQLNKVTEEPPCEPSDYPKIFERGIDPDVDNPDHCHSHSEIPDEWPPVDEILGYQTAVREKVNKLYGSGDFPRDVGRALWIGFEHEVMHLETLLYMLLHSDKTRPPTLHTPDWERDAKLAEAARVPNEWFDIPERGITIGLEDPEDNSGGDHHFGWDNEKPPRDVVVPAFQAKARPVTNEEYARYLEETHNPKVPASWAENKTSADYTNGYTNGYSNGYTNGVNVNNNASTPLTKALLNEKSVRTVYGLVPLEHALDWPVIASYDELAGCAAWMGGRIPTAEEARCIYSHVDGLRLKEAEHQLSKTVPAVNGHLVNDGVEETPPSRTSESGGSSQELFTSLEGCNVGFTHWHPVAVTANGNRLSGRSDMGGAWEWTSSVLEKHEGFEPMPLYPAYTADFFDGKHNIILGGSWATHPRIAGRKTFFTGASTLSDLSRHVFFLFYVSRSAEERSFNQYGYLDHFFTTVLSSKLAHASNLPHFETDSDMVHKIDLEINMDTPEKVIRPFRNNTLYRWEGGQNLEHHCGVCAIPLNHSRAKMRCLGKHVEPCRKYHPTLHFVGRAHECFTCRVVDEMHHARHKEILQLTRKINHLDKLASAISDDSARRTSTPSGTDSNSPPRVTKRQRKKLGNGTKADRLKVESFPMVDLDFISRAIHGAVLETKSGWEGAHNADNVINAAENGEQAEIMQDGDADSEDEDDEADAQTPKAPSPNPAKLNTPRQRKAAKLRLQAKRNGSSRKYVAPTTRSKVDIYDRVDPLILQRLGVEVAPSAIKYRTRKELVDKLIAAIKEDLEVLRKEEEEKVVRERGFWTWAGKPAYELMAETREEIDWATGQRRGDAA
ncbi:uncharacterized protein BP5553_10076 [Venustampulla echinocandica]|uniref:Histidine-specific methyltransferase SAM-dependent domain-containing protein n=1 Tax=Venustampulla echinocandica TaxID=2656787 RepID=A0A370TAC5_9HELO|nr:uncharacterized protein BP5553_10076 [Venustampulla echinocandica]RDL30731.1 hypothetical protein BP5553_10076 [Venustampulla echinocandica]